LQLGDKMAKEETKKAESTEAPKTATADASAAQPDPMALSIGDLKNLQGILDVASKRGAFGASEMAGVGFIYNKLTAFLQKVEGDQKAAAAQQTAPEKK
jgi:hypothetical protein|tara:strand:- start:972 stop:1268 length:297 start_codon:yes stop_codon:yes gene_type:complete